MTKRFLTNVSGSSASFTSIVYASAFYGDGSNLTGITGGTGTSSAFGNISASGNLSLTASTSVLSLQANQTASLQFYSQNNANSSIYLLNPDGPNGTGTQVARDLTIGVADGNLTISTTNGATNFYNNVNFQGSVTGKISGPASVIATYFYGDGSNLTGITGAGGTSSAFGNISASGTASINNLTVYGTVNLTNGSLNPAKLSASTIIIGSTSVGLGNSIADLTTIGLLTASGRITGSAIQTGIINASGTLVSSSITTGSITVGAITASSTGGFVGRVTASAIETGGLNASARLTSSAVQTGIINASATLTASFVQTGSINAANINASAIMTASSFNAGFLNASTLMTAASVNAGFLNASARLTASAIIAGPITSSTTLTSSSIQTGFLTASGTASVSGRLTASAFAGDGSLLTGITGLATNNYQQTLGAKINILSTATTPASVVAVTITTQGNPVQITVTGDAENVSAGGWVRLQLYRGPTTPIGNDIQAEGSAASENSPYALQVVDTPAAGTYTYYLMVTSIAGSNFNFGENTGPVITAIELGGTTSANPTSITTGRLTSSSIQTGFLTASATASVVGAATFSSTITTASNIVIGTLKIGSVPTFVNSTNFVFMNNGATPTIGTGTNNIVIGFNAMVGATGGNSYSQNIAIGSSALYYTNELDLSFTSGRNTAIGHFSLSNVGSTLDGNGFDNTAVGYNSQVLTLGANYNTSIGSLSASAMGRGTRNTAIGYGNLATASGSHNTSVGYLSGNLTTGSFNTIIGSQAALTLTTGSNNVVIGYNADVAAATSSNTFTMGNSTIAQLRAAVTTITALSDERDKTDIEDLPVGLDIINRVRPVKFIWNMRDGGKVGTPDYGILAQQLQEVQEGNEWLDLVYQDNPDKLEATPGKLLYVMIKAMQELSASVSWLQNRITELEGS